MKLNRKKYRIKEVTRNDGSKYYTLYKKKFIFWFQVTIVVEHTFYSEDIDKFSSPSEICDYLEKIDSQKTKEVKLI